MKKTVKIILVLVAVILLIIVLKYFMDANSKAVEDFKVEEPFYTTISTKAVATGKLNPEEEVALKPQISGIVDEIFVDEGDVVKKGDLIATIRVVPNEQTLVQAQSRIKTSQLAFDNAKIQYDRNKALFEKGVISKQDFENIELSFNQAKETYSQSQNDYQITKKGSISGGSGANTSITAQIDGTILEIPVREGDQVIESNTFNDGTTIATIADMSLMIFEGKVDEAEVGKLKEGKEIKIVLGAIQDKHFPGKLTFVAPKGIEENGAVQFTIKADVSIENGTNIRAGYSANAEIDLEGKDSVFSIREALLQYDRITDKPFVEIQTGEGKFERKDVKVGLSDGINVEILDGVKKGDKIKVWNKASKDNNEDEQQRRRNN
ncbi:efflux RND transporter periplasmic adaptor subunit [Confluentibacter lentus]|uniref:efflux RND transporter periplasmic adaptor subunit n=1 Tax=Confluentibacter lentus TaxID=1699412 RepID=UPI000C289A97|nr:efflux RND transporter periplasmic adaptor subunit [Confluentibacter lentus]